MHKAEAWVLHKGEKGAGAAELERTSIEFEGLKADEVLVKPLYGCWEGNMGHALQRKPIDICRMRKEDSVVIGNAGVMEILEIGKNVTTVQPGQKAILFCNGEWDQYGYPKKIFGYDTPNTIGMLSTLTKLHEKQVIAIPEDNTFDLRRWAAFSLRYITAWSNFRLAYGTLRLQLSEKELPVPVVWGWGGGVSLAELHLAHLRGCKTYQVSSRDHRQKAAKRLGITPIDRNEFPNLCFDEKRYATDLPYKKRYRESEVRFLEIVEDLTYGNGVNVFLDYVGSPVLRATLKAMARQGIIATAGWKEGMNSWFIRAIECIDRHQHLHTHYARYSEGVQAVRFAMANNWLPQVDERVYTFEEIPELARNYLAGNFTYFPCYSIHGE